MMNAVAKMGTLKVLPVVLVTVASSVVLAESGRQVIVDSHVESESYMWTMTKDTFYGGVFGALVGGAILLIGGIDGDVDPMILAYSTGGGALLGVGFGVWDIADRRQQVRGPSVSLHNPMSLPAVRGPMARWAFNF